MKKVTVKEIVNLEDDELEKMMTEEEFDRMKNLGFEYTWQLLDSLQDGASLSELEENEEYVTISEYLDYLEETKNV